MQNGLTLSLAVRTAPQNSEHPVALKLPVSNGPASVFANVQLHIAMNGAVAVPTDRAANEVAETPAVVVRDGVAPDTLQSIQHEALGSGDAPLGAQSMANEHTARPDVTSVALTPQVAEYIDGVIGDRMSRAIKEQYQDTVEEIIEGKVTEALSTQECTLAELDGRVQTLEENVTELDDDDIQEMRDDISKLEVKVALLCSHAETVAALTATCEAMAARFAELERALGVHKDADREGIRGAV